MEISMQIITGENVEKLVNYSFGDHAVSWDKNLHGTFKFANATNIEFIEKCKEFEGKLMTLYIDNLRLYPRYVETDKKHIQDRKFVEKLMLTNNLLALCSLLPSNGFIIFTGQEDTPIDSQIQVPFNVVKICAVNAVYNSEKVVPFPFGVQRKIGDDNRIEILEKNVEEDKLVAPRKWLYINCGVERNPEREPLKKFETNDWVTTRFDKDSKFFPYDRYQDFLDEIRDHRFMICPPGHGMDTHRVWECLYMRRVPVMKDHPYYRKLMEGFPVLFVKSWDEVTLELLEKNINLFLEVHNMDMLKLDLNTLFLKCLSI